MPVGKEAQEREKERKRAKRAALEIEETLILVDFLHAHNLDFDDVSNFSRTMVLRARNWHFETGR